MFREGVTFQGLASGIHDSFLSPNRTYSSSEARCERDPSNEPRHYSSPVRAVSVVAIAAARIVHGIDVVQLLVYHPIIGQQDAGDGSELEILAVEFRGSRNGQKCTYPYDVAIHEVK